MNTNEEPSATAFAANSSHQAPPSGTQVTGYDIRNILWWTLFAVGCTALGILVLTNPRGLAVLKYLSLGVVSAFFAYRKGYAPKYWLLSAGLVGLVILALFPNPKNPSKDEFWTPHDKELGFKKGNITGIVLSLTVIICLIASVILSHTATP